MAPHVSYETHEAGFSRLQHQATRATARATTRASATINDVSAQDTEFELFRKASFSRLGGQRVQRQTTAFSESEDVSLQEKKEKMWKLMELNLPDSTEAIQQGIVNHVGYTLARTRFKFNKEDCYRATAYSVRDRLIKSLSHTLQMCYEQDVKRCYYLSLEFLLGRALQNALVNLDIEDEYRRALSDLGYNLEELYDYEHESGLGNGGLGRLAACFLDSMATLNFPCWGYGIRYTYGIFEQKILGGRQIEHPDYWLVMDNPWEICRHDVKYPVRFYGRVNTYTDPMTGRLKHKWVEGSIIQAVAYDNPIPGYDTLNCINLRLWKATPGREFDFASFNAGMYLEAVQERQCAESISAVLYPNDNTEKGKILRLQQQYFFICATIQDVLRRFKRRENFKWEDLPNKIAIQLNDTHPAVAIPELMRILIDIEDLEWDFAWNLVKKVFSYTNHTVLPEALEKWSLSIFENLLPRHVLIINEINYRFLVEVRSVWGDTNRIKNMSIYHEGPDKMLRMSNLAIIGSHKVNGVAAIHSDILKGGLFKDFADFYKEKGDPSFIVNMTNGVTPRRWMYCSNKLLSNLMSKWVGSDQWLVDLDKLRELEKHKNDPKLIKEWQEVKLANKKNLAEWVFDHCGVIVDPTTMLFDIQVKLIHEYKRQLMNLFYICHRYLKLKRMSPEERKKVQPRACMMGGKAAPGYFTAKTIIKMANNMGAVINNDTDVQDQLKMVFLPNYNVSAAMVIIPADDISHQISTAGTEASGTSNMKFVMNGGLLIGTLDGANVEIKEECGDDTMFIFGLKENEVEPARADARRGHYPIDNRLREVFAWIRQGGISLGEGDAQAEFNLILDHLCNNGGGHNGDFYLLCKDFPDFCRAQDDVDVAYKDQDKWTQLCIQAASRMGKFSSDRTIKDYAKTIWNIEPCYRTLNIDDESQQIAGWSKSGQDVFTNTSDDESWSEDGLFDCKIGFC